MKAVCQACKKACVYSETLKHWIHASAADAARCVIKTNIVVRYVT